MTTSTLRWHYLADGKFPDADLAVIAAVAEDEGGTFNAEVAYQGDGVWTWAESGEPLGPDHEVYAWASDPELPAYRSPHSKGKVA